MRCADRSVAWRQASLLETHARDVSSDCTNVIGNTMTASKSLGELLKLQVLPDGRVSTAAHLVICAADTPCFIPSAE
eukprot:scaffold2720_cov212-Pinguiococcus_pyrenoidosus.AAC.3